MALKKIAGAGGSITTISGFNGHFRSFDWDVSFPEQETTGFTDSGFASFVPVGGIRLTGTINGVNVYDDTNGQPFPDAFGDGSALAVGDLAGLTGTITLTFITGCTLAATCNINGVGGSRPENGIAECNWRYGSSGALTIVWDETA
jgi:hypothetical protein